MTLASRRRWLLQVVAATAGGRAAMVAIVFLSFLLLVFSVLPAFVNNFAALREASFPRGPYCLDGSSRNCEQVMAQCRSEATKFTHQFPSEYPQIWITSCSGM